MSAATVSRAELAHRARAFPAAAVRNWGLAFTGLGLLVVIWGLIGGHPARIWQSWHFNLLFWAGLAQGSVVLAATQKLAKGHWSGVVIRLAEAAAPFTVLVVVLFVLELFGRPFIYSWLHDPRPDVGWWLTTKWFFVRNTAVFALLAWLTWRFVRADVAPDARELASSRAEPVSEKEKTAISRDAAILILAFALGYTLLGYDLVMSLAHKWVSNLY
ncbi:MAG: hypothetical protein DMD37_04105, partial [Gemmatimonadetes bacterium]